MKKLSSITSIIISFIILTSSALHAGYYDQARRYYIYKKYDKAKEMFLKVVEKSDHGDSFYFLGEIEKIQGNYDESEKYFLTCITKNTTRK